MFQVIRVKIYGILVRVGLNSYYTEMLASIFSDSKNPLMLKGSCSLSSITNFIRLLCNLLLSGK